MNSNKIIKHMEEGNPIIIPTDTNYNLACFPDSKEAIDKIFMYKKRPKNKALSLFFLDPKDWINYGMTNNSKLMETIINKFWPGALNIVINKISSEFDYMLNGYDTISLGCISNPTWRNFMEKLEGKPIALTSANISGTADNILVTKEIADEQMGNSVKYFIESQHPILNSKSSTIISIEDKGVKVLREGDVTLEVLDKFLKEEGYHVYK